MRPLWLGCALVAAICLVYLPSLRSGFIFDDDVMVTRNALVKAGDGLLRFWFTRETPDYYPVTSSLFWLQWRLWGEHPAGYHAVNIALHALACLLLWRLLCLLRLPGAYLAALLFGLHPVNVETVAWIAQLKNTLPIVFYLAALILFIQSDSTSLAAPARRRRYVGAVLAFLFGLLSKTNIVMLPPTLLLWAWCRNGAITRRDLLRSAPFFGLSLVLGLVTVWYQSSSNIGSNWVRDDGPLSRLLLAARAIWFYLGKAVWPHPLNFVYPRWPAAQPADAAA